jgi:adenylate cyclase
VKVIAVGPMQEELRRSLRPDQVVRVGRAPTLAPGLEPSPAEETPDLWAIPWDPMLSRDHAQIVWRKSRLQVERLPKSRNPIFFNGATSDEFSLGIGEHFIIGDTTFRVVEDRVSVPSDEPPPVETVFFTPRELRQTRYQDADQRLEVLSTLPQVIREAADDRALFSKLVLLLLEAIPAADAAAIVRLAESENGEERKVEVCYWDNRDATDSSFRPSYRLIRNAVEHRRHSARSVWLRNSEVNVEASYTIFENLDWAFCTPVPGEACRGLGLYVAGRFSQASGNGPQVDLRPDLKFTDLVADILGALRDMQTLQHRQTMLGRFFSPSTRQIIASPQGEQKLAPRKTQVTILFCDLRGFSRQAEEARDDLLGLLHRVSHALDVMTECIHSQQGVIGDFQGDAALAFWGWPLDQPDAALRACRAALEIRMRFASAADRPGDPLADFQCGIGMASGEVVAGRLGTSGQFKIDVFGPVVNLASRLEGITKQLRVPILVDEVTLQQILSAGVPQGMRFRRLASLRPYGMKRTVTVSEVLPPDAGPGILSDQDISQYESALDAFNDGRWEEAHALLHHVPFWDQGKDFLVSCILEHHRKAPPDWSGVVEMKSK